MLGSPQTALGTGAEGGITIGAGGLFQCFIRCTKDGLPSQPSSGWAKEELRWLINVDSISENLENQETSVFQGKEGELAKPFRIWHAADLPLFCH